MCNNMNERMIHQVNERSFSLWSFLSQSRSAFRNPSFCVVDAELTPSCRMADLVVWEEVYITGLSSVTES